MERVEQLPGAQVRPTAQPGVERVEVPGRVTGLGHSVGEHQERRVGRDVQPFGDPGLAAELGHAQRHRRTAQGDGARHVVVQQPGRQVSAVDGLDAPVVVETEHQGGDEALDLPGLRGEGVVPGDRVLESVDDPGQRGFTDGRLTKRPEDGETRPDRGEPLALDVPDDHPGSVGRRHHLVDVPADQTVLLDRRVGPVGGHLVGHDGQRAQDLALERHGGGAQPGYLDGVADTQRARPDAEETGEHREDDTAGDVPEGPAAHQT